MKALTILKYLYNGSELGMPSLGKINEAIKELEELQNRSCKNCKFGMIYHFDDDIECVKIEADTQGIYFTSDFCCNKWESQ